MCLCWYSLLFHFIYHKDILNSIANNCTGNCTGIFMFPKLQIHAPKGTYGNYNPVSKGKKKT